MLVAFMSEVEELGKKEEELFNIGKLNTVLTIKKLEFLEVKIKL